MTESSLISAAPIYDVTPIELSVSELSDGGDLRNVYVVEDEDLKVKLRQAGDKTARHARAGLVLVMLGVDNDHDQVNVQSADQVHSMVTVVREAMKALRVAEQGLLRVVSGQ